MRKCTVSPSATCPQTPEPSPASQTPPWGPTPLSQCHLCEKPSPWVSHGSTPPDQQRWGPAGQHLAWPQDSAASPAGHASFLPRAEGLGSGGLGPWQLVAVGLGARYLAMGMAGRSQGGPCGGENHAGPLLGPPGNSAWDLCLAPLRLATPVPCTRMAHPKPRPGHSPDG